MHRPVACTELHYCSPHLRPPCFFTGYPTSTRAPCLRGGRFEICPEISSLGCIANKSYLCCKTSCLSSLIGCASNKSRQPGGKSRRGLCPWLVGRLPVVRDPVHSKHLPGPFAPGTIPWISLVRCHRPLALKFHFAAKKPKTNKQKNSFGGLGLEDIFWGSNLVKETQS